MERTVADVCPLLVPCDLSFRSYTGPVEVKGHRFWIKLSLPKDGDIKDAQLEFDWQLNLLLKGYQQALQQKLSGSTTLVDYLEQFKVFIGYLLQTRDIPEVDHTPRSAFYECILAELEEIGFENSRDEIEHCIACEGAADVLECLETTDYISPISDILEPLSSLPHSNSCHCASLARQPLSSAIRLLCNRDCTTAVMWRAGAGSRDYHCARLCNDITLRYLEYRVRDIDVDFSTIKFKTRDACQREHLLDVHVTPQGLHVWGLLVCVGCTPHYDVSVLFSNVPQYPDVPPVCHSDLPLVFTPKWKQKCSLKTIMEQFESELSRYQLFWSALDEIDQKTWVLSPNQTNRAARTRHFAIGKNQSIQVTLNPLAPCAVPEYKLLGPEKHIVKLHENLSRYLEDWNEDASLLKNLEQAFGRCIPSKEDIKREDVIRGCGVCLVDDDEEVPDIFCNDERCLQVFHKACLVQWIRTRPESRMSFDTLFGRCPYCQQPLQVHI